MPRALQFKEDARDKCWRQFWRRQYVSNIKVISYKSKKRIK